MKQSKVTNLARHFNCLLFKFARFVTFLINFFMSVSFKTKCKKESKMEFSTSEYLTNVGKGGGQFYSEAMELKLPPSAVLVTSLLKLVKVGTQLKVLSVQTV